MTATDPLPGSPEWRHDRRRQLIDLAARSRRDVGFGWLDDSGRDDTTHGLDLWINARMTYVFSIAALLDIPGSADLAAHGIAALRTALHDDEHGGWFDALAPDGSAPDLDGSGGAKRCYGHAFVLLAGASAASADITGAAELFEEAQQVHATHFWDDEAGRCVEELSRDWSSVDDYRGANSNMHTVEAYLFTADVTGDPVWLERASAICGQIIGLTARAHQWRIPEHYDRDWNPVLDLNRDRPDDPFRPFGATPGHAFEWARLVLQVDAAADTPTPWRLEAAQHLFARAVDDVLDPDTALLPYTTDWNGAVVVAERFHWVVAEAAQAADSLARVTGDALYSGLADRWWSEIDAHLIDADGSWRHELSPTLGASDRTWRGRPDAYHGVNALTLPDLPLSPTATVALGGSPR
ncbi:AGE family epimerase/isomerase [Aeromicrobium sp. CF3.5]|uniref:AGE family epimerase/isomerase n=1 Tax=Aeromicrobium sp. CF3.5 TaxID=3373078 RepID=UPI003EE6A7E6